jgi:hypothetical protein
MQKNPADALRVLRLIPQISEDKVYEEVLNEKSSGTDLFDTLMSSSKKFERKRPQTASGTTSSNFYNFLDRNFFENKCKRMEVSKKLRRTISSGGSSNSQWKTVDNLDSKNGEKKVPVNLFNTSTTYTLGLAPIDPKPVELPHSVSPKFYNISDFSFNSIPLASMDSELSISSKIKNMTQEKLNLQENPQNLKMNQDTQNLKMDYYPLRPTSLILSEKNLDELINSSLSGSASSNKNNIDLDYVDFERLFELDSLRTRIIPNRNNSANSRKESVKNESNNRYSVQNSDLNIPKTCKTCVFPNFNIQVHSEKNKFKLKIQEEERLKRDVERQRLNYEKQKEKERISNEKPKVKEGFSSEKQKNSTKIKPEVYVNKSKDVNKKKVNIIQDIKINNQVKKENLNELSKILTPQKQKLKVTKKINEISKTLKQGILVEKKTKENKKEKEDEKKEEELEKEKKNIKSNSGVIMTSSPFLIENPVKKDEFEYIKNSYDYLSGVELEEMNENDLELLRLLESLNQNPLKKVEEKSYNDTYYEKTVNFFKKKYKGRSLSCVLLLLLLLLLLLFRLIIGLLLTLLKRKTKKFP